MKILLLLVLLAAVAFLAGCASRGATSNNSPIIQRVLTEALPAGHEGYAKFEWRGQYLTIVGEGDGFKLNAAGEWTFTWLTYHRHLNVPWFSGLSYSTSAEVTLGKKP